MSSYVRYGQGSRADYDGKFLNSLSLDDTANESHYTTANHHSQTRYMTAEEEEEDDDFMDIDHTYDTLLHQISNRTVNYDSSKFHSSNEEGDAFDFDNEMDALIRETRQLTPVGKISIGDDSQSTPNDDHKTVHSKLLQENSAAEDVDDRTEEEEEEEGHTSFVSHLFSPTTLGAQLAIRKPQLLLLPPPSSSSNPETSIDSSRNDGSESVDYDYDFTVSNAKVKNLSSYTSNVNANSLFGNISTSSRNTPNVVEVEDADEEMAEEINYYPNSGFNKFENQTYLQRHNIESPFMQSNHQHIHNHHQPVQILHQHQHHHHHYYKDNETQKQKNQYTPVSANQVEEDTLPHHQLQQQQKEQIHDKYPTEVKLPLPWESNITPTERIPYLLSSYLQLIINVIVYGYALYLILKVITIVRNDINIKLNQFTSNIMVEIESCKRSYYENNCTPELIVPALEQKCAYWQKCMNQITTNGGGHISVVSAETVGIILNAFVEPLGLKFFMILVLVVLILFLFNFVFGYIRAKTYYGWHNAYVYDNDGNSVRLMGESPVRLASPKKQLSPIKDKQRQLLTPSQGKSPQYQLQY